MYKSKPVTVARPAAELAEKFSDFTFLSASLDNMSEDERAKVGDVKFERDTITINTPQVGAVTLRAIERTPERIVLQAEGSPMPMKLVIDFKPVAETSTEVAGAIDIDLPMMLKPLVGPMMQKAADQFGDLFAKLA